MAVTLTPTDAAVFDALWAWTIGLFDPSLESQFYKGYQNLVATPYNTYCVISRGPSERLNQGERSYDASGTSGTFNAVRRTKIQWQLDCYGPDAPDWADIITTAWRTMWACDMLAGAVVTPLYADEPVQMNIVNAEDAYETRFMSRLYAEVVQTVALPQDFFTSVDVSGAIPVDVVFK